MPDNNTIPALTDDDDDSTSHHTDDEPDPNPTGAKDIRNFISDQVWYDKIQDEGFALDDDTPTSEAKKKTRGTYKGPDGRYYKELYKLGKEILEKWRGHWPGLGSKNPCEARRAIAKAIHSHRISKPRPEVDDQETLDAAPSDQETLYLLNQDDIINRMWCLWVERPLTQTTVQINDRIRVFGILGLQENRTILQRLGDGSTRNRAELDDPSQRTTALYDDLASQFNDPEIKILHPPRKDKLDGHEKLDPNQTQRISIKRDGKWIKTVFLHTLSQYNKAYHKWTKGTGGGPGMPENYVNWETREETELFANYDDSGRHYLAWIYMVDKQLGFLFNVKNSEPPPDAVIEGPRQEQNQENDDIRTVRGGARKLSPRNNAMVLSFRAASGDLGGSIERALATSSNTLARAMVARPTLDVTTELEKVEGLKRRYKEDTDMDEVDKRQRMETLNNYSRTLLAKLMPSLPPGESS